MPTAKLNGQEIEFEPGMTVLQVAERAGEEIPRFCYYERLSIALLVTVATMVAACDVRTSNMTQDDEAERTASSRLAVNDTDRVRVCRAMQAAVNTGSYPTNVERSAVVSADTVRIVYAEDQLTWTTQCDFTGERVGWRLVSIESPGAGVAQVSRPPEIAMHRLDGDAVMLVRTLPGGGTAETTWRHREMGFSIGR